tara:strand:+ start:121 stop:477 length:357 start_codon:yes stop_codon:yes gene_type:complete
MKKLFNNIPNNIIIKIFKYDSTYHLIYKKLLKEFIKKTPFWRLKWLNTDFDFGRDNEYIIDFKNYNSKYEQLKFHINYWNDIYPCEYNYLSKKYNIDTEFITDKLISSDYILKKLKKK